MENKKLRKAILTETISDGGNDYYKEGTEFRFDRFKEREEDGKWTGLFRVIGYFKSDSTPSGIHSIELYGKCFNEVSAWKRIISLGNLTLLPTQINQWVSEVEVFYETKL